MKLEDVPQDMKYYEGSVLRDLAYAVDNDGNYRTILSDGWSAKNDALEVTLDAVGDECREILERVKAGSTSPLEYHAALNLMDVALLSDYTGFSKRTIRKHFKPEVFRTLDHETLAHYADVLRITVEQLTTIPE